MVQLNDAFYERLTFGVKDDDDFSWSQHRSLTLELLFDEDKDLVAYRFDDDWVSCDSLKVAADIFTNDPRVSKYLNSSEINREMSALMIQAIFESEFAPLENEFGEIFTLIEGEDKVTQNFDGCFFLEESWLSIDASIDERKNVYFEGSDSPMDVCDIFEEYTNDLNEQTYILVVEK